MSGTLTVRELIAELLYEDLDALAYIGSEDDDSENQEIHHLGSSMIKERPRGVYLFLRETR